LFEDLEELRQRLRDRDRVALFLDLDGTLASITPTPDMTRIRPQTRAALRSLVEDPRYHVTIVSGRGLLDLRNIVKLPGITLAGNHGLEIEGRGLQFLHSGATDGISRIAQLCDELRLRLRSVQGALVEAKGLTASVHYRLVAPGEVDGLRAMVQDAVAPFRDRICLTQGKLVLELRPAVAWNKGTAVQWILRETGHDQAAAIYIGDDRTDEDAFVALPAGITINVGTKFGLTAARYFVKSPAEVHAFIQYLHGTVAPRRGTGD
jgi:trehalose 6-phosphate phosphatase